MRVRWLGGHFERIIGGMALAIFETGGERCLWRGFDLSELT